MRVNKYGEPMTKSNWGSAELEGYFKAVFEECIELMLEKNRKYGSSWEADRPSTITDTIRHKIDRIRTLEDLGDDESESINDNLMDIINYCCFRKIMQEETNATQTP